MPVAMDWDTPERKIIRVTFMGEWNVDDIHRMLTKRNSMMDCVNHTVHQILDMTASTSSPSNLLSITSRAELPASKTGSLVLVVNASNYIKSVGKIMKRLSPPLFEGVYAVDSVEEAYAKIAEQFAQPVS
jgi:hypothetical protein